MKKIQTNQTKEKFYEKLNMEYQKERNHDKWHPCKHLIKKDWKYYVSVSYTHLYITDVEETSELTKAGYKPRYNYIIHWFRDGEVYQRAVYEALSEPDESATEFWASLDNTDAIASEPAGIRTEAYLNWLVAALSAILGGMIDARNTRKTGKNRSRRRDERENAQILWSVVAFCMAIGAVSYTHLDVYKRQVLA